MDPSLDLQAQQLFVATALTTQALRCLRGHVAANVDAADLLAMASRLTEQIGPIERRYASASSRPTPASQHSRHEDPLSRFSREWQHHGCFVRRSSTQTLIPGFQVSHGRTFDLQV